MSKKVVGKVKIKSQCSHILKENLDRISVLFSACLDESGVKEGFAFFDVLLLVPGETDRSLSGDFLNRLQKYVDDICGEGCCTAGGATAGGEDSSYDSDYEQDASATTVTTPGGGRHHHHHHDVSRTTSDTLAAEYADYVQSAPCHQGAADPPGYTARVEFALKLGYTERLVQSALQKLGPAPEQNELLAELIKLGAQKGGGPGGGGGSTSYDSSPTDSTHDVTEQLQAELDALASQLRPIVIDGSNVAMSHGNKEVFSCQGIQICVDWFRARGHKDIKVFVPKWRKEAPRLDNPVRDQDILAELERDQILAFTPSRLVGGKRIVCYDDRYILKWAAETDGIVVSNDNYRDLCQENAEFRKIVEERILMYSFVNDHFMPPDDPLGRSGPTLDNFLRSQPKRGVPPPQPCPYGKKCTYGNKCKYHHPERGQLPHKSVTEKLFEHAQRHLSAREGDVRKLPLGRTRSNVPPPKETHHAVVSKSRSVDNVGFSYHQNSPAAASAAGGTTQENLHRKLQRQLTLNPGCDPRLQQHQLRRPYAQQPGVATSQQQQQPMSPPYLTAAHAAANWDVHQHVTRIASAPDSYRQWPPQAHPPHTRHMQRISSCSDPQLNVWPPPWGPGAAPQSGGPHAASNQEDDRRKMLFHFNALFPEDLVTAAMQMYPEETNPQKICAAILSMSKNSP